MIFGNVNEAFIHYLSELKYAAESKPRGMKIKECLGVSFTIQNPRDRITSNSVRKVSMPFAAGEFLWYLRGSDRLDIIEYYSKIYPNFSDDNTSVNGAYGKRIFDKEASQWEQVKKILSNDPDSRQAVISIYQPRDLFISSRDIPCTCVLQYFIRDGKLNAITYMRSNDIYLGMPYDIFSFTMLQEMLAVELNVELGTYTHMVGSLHIYEKNFDLFENIARETILISCSMPKMTKDAISDEQIALLLETENSLRNNEMCKSTESLNEYWQPFVNILKEKNLKEYSCMERRVYGFTTAANR